MNLRSLVPLCASFLLLPGCDRPAQQSKNKPETTQAEQPASPPHVTEEAEALQCTPPEPPIAAPGEPAREPFRVGGSVTRPEVIHQVPLDFSGFQNRKPRPIGINIVEAVIDEKGNVTNARTLKGSDPELNAMVLANIRQWKFKPGKIAGKPVPVYYTLTVNIDVQ